MILFPKGKHNTERLDTFFKAQAYSYGPLNHHKWINIWPDVCEHISTSRIADFDSLQIPPAGILAYRVFRNDRKIIIKLLHAFMHIAALIFASVGLKAAFDSHNLKDPPIPNLYSLHSWLGLFVVVCFGLQVIYMSIGSSINQSLNNGIYQMINHLNHSLKNLLNLSISLISFVQLLNLWLSDNFFFQSSLKNGLFRLTRPTWLFSRPKTFSYFLIFLNIYLSSWICFLKYFAW